ncbi:MAG TPA: phosphatidate cytidylyltransferase [Candidatus Polarisedimenticolaceae bacterium]|nr:phosphatidate cytidylyltransferase [Candidatus Polarisedimenticolaceae bacterium]
MKRLVTAAVLVPLLYGAVKLAPPWVFFGVAVLAIGGSCFECYRIMRTCGAAPMVWPGVAAAAATVWLYGDLPPHLPPSLPLVALVVVVTPVAIWTRRAPDAVLRTIVDTIFPVAFVGLTMGYVVALRALPDPDGEDLVTLLFICLILADTAAYYVGTRLGRHKMSPQISPNKSWEGFAGAMAGAIVGTALAHSWFYTRLPLSHVVPLGLLLGITGALGDLAESVVKRSCHVKDSSAIFPGHGGIFDRTDNLLIAAPVLYYYYLWLLPGAVG